MNKSPKEKQQKNSKKSELKIIKNRFVYLHFINHWYNFINIKKKGINKMDLNGKWTLEGFDESDNRIELEATVPGCVHTDLMHHGIIKDLYWRDNSKLYQWIENSSRHHLTAEICIHLLQEELHIIQTSSSICLT